mgnify:CR=1 FL=1
MIFLTVGTLYPFDRMVKAVDAAVGQGVVNEKIIAQIGTGGYEPKHLDFVESVNKEAFDMLVRESTAMISHAGMGSISAAIAMDKPLLVMPRLKSLGENINDHQLAAAQRFAELGHVLAVFEHDDMPAKLRALKDFVPQPRRTSVMTVVKRIDDFMSEVRADRRDEW